jgi:acetylornithine deacetylase
MINASLIAKLKETTCKYENEMISLLSKLVSIPSVSGEEAEMQKAVFQLFSSLKGETTKIPMKESLREDPKYASGVNSAFEDRPQTRFFWEGKGGGKSLILCAHTDVIPAGNWKEAFKPKIEGDLLFGRGAVDDKGSIVSIYYALKALQEMNIELEGDVEVHLTNEEEVGMAGALALVREGFKADGVLVAEPTDHQIFDAGRGCLQFMIEIKGKQSHLGKKRYGVSAIEKASKIIESLVQYEDYLIDIGRGYPHFENYKYPGQVNIGKIHGGSFFSIVPDNVVLEGGVGFLPNKELEDIETDLKKIIFENEDEWIKNNTTIYFEGLKNEPYVMPDNHPFTLSLKNTLESLGRKTDVLGMMASCDARYYYNQGNMPSIAYGGINNGQSHAENEHVYLPDILETAVEYACFIINWCKKYN